MEEKEKKETRQSQIFQILKTDQKSLNKFKLDSKHVLAFNFLISSEPLPQPQQHSESPPTHPKKRICKILENNLKVITVPPDGFSDIF